MKLDWSKLGICHRIELKRQMRDDAHEAEGTTRGSEPVRSIIADDSSFAVGVDVLDGSDKVAEGLVLTTSSVTTKISTGAH